MPSSWAGISRILARALFAMALGVTASDKISASPQQVSHCKVAGTLKPGGGPIQGIAERGEWIHFAVEVPTTTAAATQVRIELLQPGSRTKGAHLYVHSGALDCLRTGDRFDYQAALPESCLPGACEELEWVIVPNSPSVLHVAVLGTGASFYVLAESAPFTLEEVALQSGPLTLEGSSPVGFASWYSIPNKLKVPDGGLGQYSFSVKSSSTGQASRLQAFRVLDPNKPVSFWVQGRPADATSWSMASWAFGKSAAFSDPSATEPTSGFLAGIEVFPSGINVTRRDLFLPCTLSRTLASRLAVVEPCDRNEGRNMFTMSVGATTLEVPTTNAISAADVVLGKSSPARIRGFINREQWKFLRIGVMSEQNTVEPQLVRITLRLSDGAAGPNSVASRIARGTMRATSDSSFPLEQLGTEQYQLASHCKPSCTLVVSVLPSVSEVKIGLEVEKDNTAFVLEAMLMDMECGWMPTCSQCSEAANNGLGCVWQSSSDMPGFCFSSDGRDDTPSLPQSCPERDLGTDCHVPGSITASNSESCTTCPAGCGWCGQPHGSTGHSGACVPSSLSDGTSWVGGHGPFDVSGSFLMSSGSCSAWHATEPESAPRTVMTCDSVAKSALAGSCEVASGNCEVCGSLAPACTFCSDPSNPSKGYCVPIAGDSKVCSIKSPWLGFNAGPRTCPPKSAPALPTSEPSAMRIAIPEPVQLPSSLSKSALGPTYGIASNAVYLSHNLDQQGGVQNVRIHVRSVRDASLRASARVDALPVLSAHAAAGLQRWGSDAEEYIMTVGTLSIPASDRKVFLALEQQQQQSNKARLGDVSAQVWVDSSPGILFTDASDPIYGDVCCGGLALYELVLPKVNPDESLEGYVVIEMSSKGKGSKDISLVAKENGVPSHELLDYQGRRGVSAQEIFIHVGPLPNGTARSASTWYVAVLASANEGLTDNGWASTSAEFSLRASHRLKVNAEFTVSGTAELGRFEFPIWAWVLIAIAFGALAGIVLLIFIWVNRILYKKFRAKMYAVSDDHSLGSPRESAKLMSNSSTWTSDVEGASSEMTRDAPTTKGGKDSGGASIGFVGKLMKGVNAHIDGHKKWYNPKRWRHMSDDDEEEAHERILKSPATRLEKSLVTTPGSPALGANLEMISMMQESASQMLSDHSVSAGAQMSRNSVGGSSSVLADAEGDVETPTSTSATPAGSIGGGLAGMNLLNERMAVLAQAEELEEKRKPRPDISNPVRLMARTASGPFQEAPVFTEEDNTSLRAKFSPLGAKKPSVHPKLTPVPEPQDDQQDPSPTGRRRLAPPPLKVLLESEEPTGDDILMLTEEEADSDARQRVPDVHVRASWADLQSTERPTNAVLDPQPSAVLPFQVNDNDGDDDNPRILPNYYTDDIHDMPNNNAVVSPMTVSDGNGKLSSHDGDSDILEL